MSARVEATRDVQAPAATVWPPVSDVTRTGEGSPENQGGPGAGGASGPEVGARSEGRNTSPGSSRGRADR